MSFRTMLERVLEPIRNQVRMVVSKALVQLIDDSKEIQLAQLSILRDEVKDNVERVQNYGFTSVPEADAETVVLFVNGNKDHGLIIACDHGKYRMKGLNPGEVAVYDKNGNHVKLTNGELQVESTNGKVTVKANGDIEIGNTNLKKLVNESFKDLFNNHVHNFNTVVGVGSPVIGVTGKPASLTGTGAISVGSTPAVPPTGLLGDTIKDETHLTNKVKAQ